MLENLTRDDFAAQLNTKFRIKTEESLFEVELVEVTESKIYPRQESFILFFLMPADFPRFQGIYSFEHDKIGTNDIFVVPIEKEDDGIVFQAVFNRLREKIKDRHD